MNECFQVVYQNDVNDDECDSSYGLLVKADSSEDAWLTAYVEFVKKNRVVFVDFGGIPGITNWAKVKEFGVVKCLHGTVIIRAVNSFNKKAPGEIIGETTK